MKKRTIVLWSIFTCFILLMIPVINTSQYKTTKDVIEEKIEKYIRNSCNRFEI